MALIEIEQLVFEYPAHRALDGVSLHIEAGSVTALVGPNGAGKSTLMRCMAGLEQPLSGRIRVNGISVTNEPRKVHRHLGYLSDFFGLYEGLLVKDCLTYAALAMGVAHESCQARVAQVAKAMDLESLLDRRPGELSRGQRQRLAIGQAIIHQPLVLLLDEPASGLDPEARSNLSALFRQLQAGGMTLIVSSHILSELDEYSTHILSIRDGRITSHAALQDTVLRASESDDALFALELGAPAQEHQQWLDTLVAVLGQAACEPAANAHAAPAGAPYPVWLPQQAQRRAALLAELVRAGVPVAGLWPQRQRLQEQYQQSLKSGQPQVGTGLQEDLA